MKNNNNESKDVSAEEVSSSNNQQKNEEPVTEVPSSNKAPSLDRADKLAPHNLSRLFFNMPTERPDGIFEPLFCGLAEQLLTTGLPKEKLKEAFLIHLAINSARLGYPISVLLMPDDPLTAVGLMDRVVKLAPEDSFKEFQKMTLDQLFVSGGAQYRNKCIVTSDPEGFIKIMPDLELMLTRGHLVRQELLNKKYEISLEEFRAEWPVSFIGIAPVKKRENEWHPSIIRLPVTSSAGITTIRDGSFYSQAVGTLPIQRVRKTFERLQPRRVLIPYIDQVRNPLAESGVNHLDIKMDLLTKVISMCAIINNPHPVTIEELGSYVYDTDIRSVKQWLIQTGKKTPSDNVDDGAEHITADKKDYYLARLLLDGLISSDNTYMTERQKRLYEAVRNINLGKLNLTSTVLGDEAKSLARIAAGSSCWADIGKIFDFINNGSDPIIAMATIYKDLVTLLDKGILGRSKPPKRNQYGYFVMRLNMDQSLPLPSLSNIIGTGSSQRTLEIINPLTAKIEKI